MGDGYEGAAVPRLPSRVLPWEFCHWWCSPQNVRVVGTEGQQIGLGEGWRVLVGGQAANVAVGNPQHAVYKWSDGDNCVWLWGRRGGPQRGMLSDWCWGPGGDKGCVIRAFRVAHWGRSCLPCRRHIREGWKDPLCRGRRATPGYLPGTLHEPRSLAGYHPWGLKESDVTEHTQTHTHGNEVDQPDRVTWHSPWVTGSQTWLSTHTTQRHTHTDTHRRAHTHTQEWGGSTRQSNLVGYTVRGVAGSQTWLSTCQTDTHTDTHTNEVHQADRWRKSRGDDVTEAGRDGHRQKGAPQCPQV